MLAIVVGIACGAAPIERKTALDSSPCRLPIGGLEPGIGGFLYYPQGQFTSDHTSALGYSAQHQRWLPVPRQLISPDGKSYIPDWNSNARRDRETLLTAVDIATGAVRPLGSLGTLAAPPQAWFHTGIYFMKFAETGQELWVFDPAKQTSRLVTGQSNETGLPLFKSRTYFNGGAAWVMTGPNTSGPSFDILVRVDLASGRTEEWYRATPPSPAIAILGFGPANPLVMIGSDGGIRVGLLAAPRRVSFIESGTFRPALGPWNYLSDSHGLWLLANDGGIWLYRDQRMSRVGAAPLPQLPPTPSVRPMHFVPMPPPLSIAGPCASVA